MSYPSAVVLLFLLSRFSLNFKLFHERLFSSWTPSNILSSHPLPPHPPTSPLFALLCPVLQQSFIYVSTTSMSGSFSLSLPKARKPSCFIPQRAQGETSKGVRQPYDPSSVICKRKSTLLIEGGLSVEGLGGGYGRCYSSVGGVRGEKGEITPVISLLHVLECVCWAAGV